MIVLGSCLHETNEKADTAQIQKQQDGYCVISSMIASGT